MDENTTFGETVETGIDSLIDKIKQYVNLPKETEELIESALHQAAEYGLDTANALVQALRERSK